MANRERKVMEAALWMATGAVIGAGAALLLAPQSGKETRRDIARYAKKARNGAEEAVEDFSEAVVGMADAVGKKAGAVVDRGADVALETKKGLLKTIDEARESLERQRTRLAKLVG